MAVAQMSAMISHEFRNSLTSLRMILELQLESENLRESESESLTVALGSVSHMENIVTQLVSFTRPDPIKVKPENINSVITESIRFVDIHLKKNNITLNQQLDETLPRINLDTLRMKEVFGHLLLNSVQAVALHHKNNQEGNICIITKPHTLEYKIWDQNYSVITGQETEYKYTQGDSEYFLAAGTKCIQVLIKDNGGGMNAEGLKHIFDPFFTTKSSGTGLGLPMVKRIINEHGGIITINSKIDEGSIFKVYLPQVPS
jgi:signal transduction histidine kinase